MIKAQRMIKATMRELLWYLAITEWVILSLPPIHLRIESDVRTGDIAYRLPRPISYLGSRLAEEAGDVALRMTTLGASATMPSTASTAARASWARSTKRLATRRRPRKARP